MKAVSNHDPHLCFTGLILAVLIELALPTMGQVSTPAPKVEHAAAVARPLPIPPPTYGRVDPTDPTATNLSIQFFLVDPYQFNEVVRPKLPAREKEDLGGSEVYRDLRQWFAQLGVDMNQTGKSMFWHDDGRLNICASSADLDTIQAAITAMGKEYSGEPHPPLEIRVIHVAPDAFEEGLRKLRLLSEAATNTPAEVRAAVLRRISTLGVNLARPKTFYYNRSRGYLAVCATRADLDIVEPEVARLQGTPAQAVPRR
jgi:hypothetical protein